MILQAMLLFCMDHLSFRKASQYMSVFVVIPCSCSIKSIIKIPLLSPKTVAIIFEVEHTCLNLFAFEDMSFFIALTADLTQKFVYETQVSSQVTMYLNSSSFPFQNSVKNVRTKVTHFCLYVWINIFKTF